VTTIPVVPFAADGSVDIPGHRRNVRYLLDNNSLEGGLRRVVAVAGTSLIQHLDESDQNPLVAATGLEVGESGVLVSGITPQGGAADRLVAAQLQSERPPDAFLIMPLSGVYDPNGYGDAMSRLGDVHGPNGARFVVYMRNRRDAAAIQKLLLTSEYFIGVKIGTGIAEVEPMVTAVGRENMVIWGIGELNSTAARKLGARGHTSGTAIVAAGVADELSNAHRRGDYAAALRLEGLIRGLEEIRFRDGRMYNYSAVVEAMIVGGFDDVVPGVGHALNPRVPPEIADEVRKAVEPIRVYHG
jgi:dihydrodipicolinate synthase/N-acetylneuraminate lyase